MARLAAQGDCRSGGDEAIARPRSWCARTSCLVVFHHPVHLPKTIFSRADDRVSLRMIMIGRRGSPQVTYSEDVSRNDSRCGLAPFSRFGYTTGAAVINRGCPMRASRASANVDY